VRVAVAGVRDHGHQGVVLPADRLDAAHERAELGQGYADDPDEGEQFVQARRLAIPALEQKGALSRPEVRALDAPRTPIGDSHPSKAGLGAARFPRRG